MVYLLHGLGGTRLDMWPVSRRLKRVGFEVCNWGYRSIGNRIETHAIRLSKELERLNQRGLFPHIAAHSMGGIVLRKALVDNPNLKLGRVVLLAPPSRGSHLARSLNPWIGWLSPAIQQLSDEEESYVNQLPNSLLEQNIKFGIIVASKDRCIAPGHTDLSGETETAIVNGHHGNLPWYTKTIDLVESYLIRGQFEAPPRLAAGTGQ